MAVRSENTPAELQSAELQRGAERLRADAAIDHPDQGRMLGIDEDATAAAVTRNAAPIVLAVLAIIAAAVVALGAWSWFGAG